MFHKHSSKGYEPAVPGVSRKTLVHGDKTLMVEFRLERGSVIPRHAHPHEQTGYLIKGHILFTIGAERFEAVSGDSWCVAGGVEHSVETLEDAVAIEIFTPVREDYLPRT